MDKKYYKIGPWCPIKMAKVFYVLEYHLISKLLNTLGSLRIRLF
jgi:hypothetical protein